VLDTTAGGFGDLPLVTISSTDPGSYRLRQQDALAALSTRGRHIVASNSGHWIPLDQPGAVIDSVNEVLRLSRGPGSGIRDPESGIRDPA
jgi:pimeloyl-ACP methyl ester carboxylesterase